MTFVEFEERAAADWDRIPDEFKAGVDALVVLRKARAHGTADGVYTLGECITEAYPSDFGGPDTIRSELVLYFGSFRRLAAVDTEFDWEGEIWETLTHELKHHLESLASQDDLEGIDAAMEENFRRHDGEVFDARFYLRGVRLGDRFYRLEDSFFLESHATRGAGLDIEWQGATYRITIPDDQADVLFITVDGLSDPPDEFVVVNVRDRPFASRLLSVLRRERSTIASFTVSARTA